MSECTSRWLTIVEVSQKQNYIFRSKKLKNNIIASDVIAYLTSPQFFEETAGDLYTEENLVYAGGGHTVLEFASSDQAYDFSRRISKYIIHNLNEIEVFIKTIPYEEMKDGKKQVASDNLGELIGQLEIKKAIRTSSLHQGSFGIEQRNLEQKDEIGEKEQKISRFMQNPKLQEIIDPYKLAEAFDKLGGSHGVSNFLAVIHIDGNQMGKKVKRFDDTLKGETFGEYKKKKRAFSEKIEERFQNAYLQILKIVAKKMKEKKLDKLDLADNYFPIRKIILAGDDVCIVTEGRIGLECARLYLEELFKANDDNMTLSACAGVALVHRNYPFYKAYELAERLCFQAKKCIAGYAEHAGADICAIDWHIEFGEIAGGMDAVRAHYITKDKRHLEGRPYIVCGDECGLNTVGAHQYRAFLDVIRKIQVKEDSASRRKLKKLRSVLKSGSIETDVFIKKNLLTGVIDGKEPELFDALELMDTFISLD